MYLYNYNNFNAMFEIQEQLKKQTKTLQANKAAVIFICFIVATYSYVASFLNFFQS